MVWSARGKGLGWLGQDRRKRAMAQERGGTGEALGLFLDLGMGGKQDRRRDGGSLSGTPRL